MNTKHSSLDNWENDIDMTYQTLQQKLTSKERNEQQPSLNSCKSENNWSDSDNVVFCGKASKVAFGKSSKNFLFTVKIRCIGKKPY